MRIINLSNKFNNNSFITLQHEDWLSKQRVAGQCVAEVMQILQQLVRDKTTLSGLELDKITEEEIIKRKCIPTFKDFKGFPNSLCLSVNKQLVHGIPTNAKFEDGDIISFDFGATYEGAIADSASSIIYGAPLKIEHTKLMETARTCLYNAIRAMSIGKRLGVVGNAIYKTARNAGFNIINQYGGHGIGWNKPHADLFVPNRSLPDDGIVIQPGLVIAIEPLLVPGNCRDTTKVGDDGWTVYTEDVGCHTEHSLFVHSDHIEIITYRLDEEEFIPRQVYFN